ncbi:MAG: DUF1343 domain-containing protein [Candidatus Solibacter usitatus]|nr:DUF1343 domain-containing protein [Candidatus Solibacter usitatus]
MKRRCRTGLERLVEGEARQYKGLRVGLIANPASVDAELRHASEMFASCPDLRLAALFGPQHGAKADRQDNMIESPDEFEPRLHIPVYSLYGEHREPTAAMLRDLDVLFCDLTDVGTRAYTFVWTMALAMRACARRRNRFVVLDRPNPIGGVQVEGNVLEPAFESFIGMYPIPMRHALTMGELATLMNEEYGIGADLEVVELEGWQREQWMEQTGLPWVMPSPNMPSVETAAVYPGMVLVEGTNLSEGRGTTRPFELAGAPFLDGREMEQTLNALCLEGVRFREAWFRPAFDKWQEELCGGVQVHVTDRLRFKPYRTGLAVVRAAMALGGESFAWRQPPFEYENDKLPVDILAGTDAVRRGLERGAKLEEMEAAWAAGLGEFQRLRSKHLRY